MLDQRQVVDEFPAASAVLSAVRGPGPALDLTVAVRTRRDPGTALADVLVDSVPLAGHEPLAGVPDLVDALGQVGAAVTSGGGGAYQKIALRRQGDPERVHLAWAGPAALADTGRHQVHLRSRHERTRGGDLGGAPPGRGGRGPGQIGYG